MSLLQMSFSGAILILVITAVRAAAMDKLSKTTFLFLWGLVLIRLLIPFSIPSAVSVYSLVDQSVYADALEGTSIGDMLPIAPETQMAPTGETPRPGPRPPFAEAAPPVSVRFVVWFVGMASWAVFFTAIYLSWLLKFQSSAPVDNGYLTQWLKEHPSKRPISIRQSDSIDAPLTYGLFRPVILMPRGTDWEDTNKLQYILLHEYLHIRRFDILIKLIATAALCVHWFNPLVWVMVLLLNRDLELSCDESVVRRFGVGSRAAYAHILVSMEAQKSGLMPLYNSFSKNAIEERITSIMKIKKISLLAVFFAVLLVVGISSVFITSAEGPDRLKVNTRFVEFLNMPYGQFKEQVGTEAEFYHGLYFQASVPEENIDVVFRGSYDEEIAGTVLSDEDKVFRVESSLENIIGGIGAEMTSREFKEALDLSAGFAHEVVPDIQEGLTAYYVAYHYIEAWIDSDGDGSLDIQLNIALDEADRVTPDARIWIFEAAYEDIAASTISAKAQWVWPTVSKDISLSYGEAVGRLVGEDGFPDHINAGDGLYAAHINIRGEAGDDVYAALDGQVDEAAFDMERGRYIVISNDEGIKIIYGHLDEMTVAVGSKVSAGEKIGTVGKTGWATSDCLLFAVFTADGAVDPTLYYE